MSQVRSKDMFKFDLKLIAIIPVFREKNDKKRKTNELKIISTSGFYNQEASEPTDKRKKMPNEDGTKATFLRSSPTRI